MAGTAATVGASHARHHAVAVQHFLHLAVGQEQVWAWLVRDHESKSVPMRGDLARYKGGMIGQRISAAAVGADLAVTLHGVQAAAQDFLGGGLDLEDTCQAGRIERFGGVTEDCEDFLATWNGMSRLLQIDSFFFGQ